MKRIQGLVVAVVVDGGARKGIPLGNIEAIDDEMPFDNVNFGILGIGGNGGSLVVLGIGGILG